MTRRWLGASLLVLALGLAVQPAACEDKKESKAEEKWTPLFNGKDLTGWTLPVNTNPGEIDQVGLVQQGGKIVAYEGHLKKDDKRVPLWRVEDGLLIGSGPHSHLFTERGDYANFRYRVEAMINDHGNSGQYFRTQLGRDFPRGYEAQINATHGDPIRTGSLYPGPFRKWSDVELMKMKVLQAPNKPDEWFTQEVIADGNHIVIKVNDKTTVDFVDEKNTFRTGHFALQGHDPGTVVKFRKIEVIELPAAKDEK
jgi:hypothetical protein